VAIEFPRDLWPDSDMNRDLSELILELGEDERVPAASWIVGGVQATTVNHSSTRDTLNKFIQTIRE